MARRLNWEKANFRDKAEKPHDLEHVTIAGAPDMDTIFRRKPTFMERSGLTAKQRKKKRAQSPKALGSSGRFTKILCRNAAQSSRLWGSANHAKAALRKHTKRPKDIFKALRIGKESKKYRRRQTQNKKRNAPKQEKAPQKEQRKYRLNPVTRCIRKGIQPTA